MNWIGTMPLTFALYVLSQRLLPFLIAARGQMVFINSSVGLSVRRPEVGQYAATWME
jgi:hypothetical protein